MVMQEYVQAGITVLAVINPVICGVMLLQIDGKPLFRKRLHDATKASVMIKAANRIHAKGQKVFARFLGLILIAMGLQFVLTGLKDFMVG
jgi:small neutral amino acid transporter SnatA (MarC family)